jgi:hypothetical protein
MRVSEKHLPAEQSIGEIRGTILPESWDSFAASLPGERAIMAGREDEVAERRE